MRFLRIGFWLCCFYAVQASAATSCFPGSADCQATTGISGVQLSSQQTGLGNAAGPVLQQAPMSQAQDLRQQPARSIQPRMVRPKAPLTCAALEGRLGLVTPSAGSAALQEKGNDLQRHLCQSLDLALPVFGQDLFMDGDLAFTAPEAGAVAPDYVIGVGDSFAVRVWGQLDANLQLTVDRSGNVFIPKVGNIPVVGVQFSGLKSHISNEIGKVYRNFDVAVTMGQLRAVQVFVVGFVKQPGSYSVSSLSTILNALYAAGGPQASGSLRNVELRRGGKVVSQFDLYALFLKGDKSHDVLLQAGDVINVPAVAAQAAIYGAVQVPAVYEVKEGESLRDLIALAGGASQFARDGKISVERLDVGKGRSMESVALTQAASFVVRGGDVVQLGALSAQVSNAVTLRGAVGEAIRVQWVAGMKVSDLIPSRDALLSPEFWRKTPDGASNGAMAGQEVVNALRKDENEVNWDYALVERINLKDFSSSLVSFNLGKAILEKDPQANLTLEAGDVVHIYSKRDIRVPSQKQSRYVRLEGEVAVPGVYPVRYGETLLQLLERIGGLTPQAYLYGAEFSRESVRLKQREELRHLAEYMEDASRNTAQTMAQNALSQADVAAAKAQAEQQQAVAQKLRNLEVTGRIVLGLKPDSTQVTDLPSVALENGDRFFVPPRPATVHVIGAVFNRNSAFIFSNDRSLGDYMDLSGGPTEVGDSNSTFVMRVDGSVVSTKQKKGWFSGSFVSLPALPGDTIIVPEKLDRTTFMKGMMDWTQILANLGVGAAAIKSLGN